MTSSTAELVEDDSLRIAPSYEFICPFAFGTEAAYAPEENSMITAAKTDAAVSIFSFNLFDLSTSFSDN